MAKMMASVRVENPICRALRTMIRTGFPASHWDLTAWYIRSCG